MFRVTRYIKSLMNPAPVRPDPEPAGPVVVWNLTRRCNMSPDYSYSISVDPDCNDELSTDEICTVMDDLRTFGVPALILSGGEPLMRPDIFDISRYAKDLGFDLSLITNGTLITEENIDRIAGIGFDHVDIGIDGLERIHDQIWQKKGAFKTSIHAVALCKQADINVGLRFNLTPDNFLELPGMLALIDENNIDNFYLSHLDYTGHGGQDQSPDAFYEMTREAMKLIFYRCHQELRRGVERQYVTGNNDADGPFLIEWARKNYPDQVGALEQRLNNRGGNGSGVNFANIDSQGMVYPDTFWWNYSLGNVRQTPFSRIWSDSSDPLMQGLRQHPRPVKGRCADCKYLSLCNGNTRVRAFSLSGDAWEEDPGCYLTNEEIGVPDTSWRMAVPDNATANVRFDR